MSNKNDPTKWVELVEPYLPASLSKHEGKVRRVASSNSYTIRNILEQAAKSSNIDVLTYLAIDQGRLDASLYLACATIDVSDGPSKPWEIPAVLSSFSWPDNMTLDQISSQRLGAEDRMSSQSELSLSGDQSDVIHGNSTLARSLSTFYRPAKDVSRQRSRQILGQLWLSLGRMVLSAHSAAPSESKEVLARVAYILMKLHRNDYPPDDMLTHPTYSETPTAQRSPVPAPMIKLNDSSLDLTTKGIASLSLDNSFSQGYSESLESIKSEYGLQIPAQWLEHILWCCVHGGWLMEGASIVSEMKDRSKHITWSLRPWQDLAVNPQRTDSSEDALNPNSISAPKVATSQYSDPTAISAEVVVALADGLAARMQGDRRIAGQSPSAILDKLFVLRNMLDRDNMSLGRSTWDAFIARLVNSPGLHRIDANPRLFERILDLAKTYGAEPNAQNAASQIDDPDEEDLFSYVFEGSAAAIGLYHRAILSNIRARDVSGALRVLASLQNLTDKNKQKSLRDFFEELKSTKVTHGAGSQQNSFPGVEYPGFFPSLPSTVLAELLDLLNDCGGIDLARWMVSSSDIDGPLIPESEYGNQTIAPALIRFAATTSDTGLLRQVTRAQTVSVSGHTLVALCESRIRQANYQGAGEVFALVRDYALHEWTASDFGLVLRALLIQMFGIGHSQDLSHTHSVQAYELCQRLLRGDMGQTWGPMFTQIDTIVEILASLDDHLARLCSNLRPRSQQYVADLPTSSFNYILDGAVKIWGSAKGQYLWEKWCSGAKNQPFSHGGQSRTARSVAKQFSAAAPTSSAGAEKPEENAFESCIEANLPTIRIIAQQALTEHRRLINHAQDTNGALKKGTVTAEFERHDVLEWAAGAFRRFGLSDGDIDYELQGYLSTRQPNLDLSQSYQPETMRIWRAFTGARKRWAQEAEKALRNLASSKAGQQLFYEGQAAAERFLLLSLAHDLGLQGDTRGEGDLQLVVILKDRSSKVPAQTLDEVLDVKQDGYSYLISEE